MAMAPGMRTITERPEGPRPTTSRPAAHRGWRDQGGDTEALAIPSSVPFIGLGWDDVLFLLFAAALIGTALLVVTMRDIIRCGLALMASLGALAGIYVLLGAPLVATAQVLVYIGGVTGASPFPSLLPPD